MSLMSPDYELTKDDIQQIKRLIGLIRDITHRYANLAERMSGFEDRADEWFTESTKAIDKLISQVAELRQLAILEKTGNIQKASLVREHIQLELQADALRQELAQLQTNLNKARLKAAKHGMGVPTELENEIETYVNSISRTRVELDRIKQELE